MSVCYFNNDYEKLYRCDYEIKEEGIYVKVEYNVHNEIPAVNGFRTFGTNTEFENRDILIIDYNTKMNYLLKEAFFKGCSTVSGTPDSGIKTEFFSRWYFYDKDYEKLSLLNGNNIKKIRIFSKMINEFIGNPSVIQEKNENEHRIILKRDSTQEKMKINKNNVKQITLSDYWNVMEDIGNEINIKLSTYVEIEVRNCINLDDVYQYVSELIIYFQLLKPCKFDIDEIFVEIDNHRFGVCMPITKVDKSKYHKNTSVEDGICNFLSKCYNFIPYRNSKNEIRNIHYIILNSSRNLEDNFLMFYRFIECYYKKQKIDDIKTSFIRYAFENNYKKIHKIEKLENLVQEIICLRNHYVHEGYFLIDETLYIAFPKINRKANPKNYVVKNVSLEWIYERTKMLYEIVIDIIFRNMLGYDEYKFDKHF